MWIYSINQEEYDRNTLVDAVIVALSEEKGEEYIEAHLNVLALFSDGFELFDSEHLNYEEIGMFLSAELPDEFSTKPDVASYVFKFMLDNNYIQKRGMK